MKKEPDWVCLPCATKRGARIPQGHIATWHIDTCGICGKQVEVTEPRDFGRSRDMLTLTPKQYAKIKARAEQTMKLKDVKEETLDEPFICDMGYSDCEERGYCNGDC